MRRRLPPRTGVRLTPTPALRAQLQQVYSSGVTEGGSSLPRASRPRSSHALHSGRAADSRSLESGGDLLEGDIYPSKATAAEHLSWKS